MDFVYLSHNALYKDRSKLFTPFLHLEIVQNGLTETYAIQGMCVKDTELGMIVYIKLLFPIHVLRRGIIFEAGKNYELTVSEKAGWKMLDPETEAELDRVFLVIPNI